MTVAIPTELESELQTRAEQLHVSVGVLVREAIDWSLCMDRATIDELTAWQEVRDEALDLMEGPQT